MKTEDVITILELFGSLYPVLLGIIKFVIKIKQAVSYKPKHFKK